MDYHDKRIIDMQVKQQQISKKELNVDKIIEAFHTNIFRMNQKELHSKGVSLFDDGQVYLNSKKVNVNQC